MPYHKVDEFHDRNGRPLLFQERRLSNIVGLLFGSLGIGFGKSLGSCLKEFSVADQVFVNSRVEVLSLSIRQDRGVVVL